MRKEKKTYPKVKIPSCVVWWQRASKTLFFLFPLSTFLEPWKSVSREMEYGVIYATNSELVVVLIFIFKTGINTSSIPRAGQQRQH